ncbi:MAG: two-component regulator propeller domain-containing protein [Pseudomonadales bacterium]|nr:two-component regulator propeller domain-containing protein [Pseudomonadales bacterium]
MVEPNRGFPSPDFTIQTAKRSFAVWIGVCLFFGGWLFAESAFALVRLAEQRNIVFDRLGTEDGLSQASVTTITQDNQGFIWIGTQEGLNRFDGYSFKTFYHSTDDPKSLAHSNIGDILTDSAGVIWIGTDNGLNRYNELFGNFEKITIDDGSNKNAIAQNSVNVLYEDDQQQLWIGTDQGLLVRSPTGEINHYHHDAAAEHSLGQGAIRDIIQDSQGRLWIGTERGGLNLLENEAGRFKRYVHDKQSPNSISNNNVRAILEDQDGKIWVANFNGAISVLDTETDLFDRLESPTGTTVSRTRTLLKDAQNRIWIGTNSGLYLRAEDGYRRFSNDPTDPHSLSDNTISELYQDAGGVIWVATFNGISRWNASVETFPHLKRDAVHKSISNSVSSFAEAPNGDVWIGSFNGLNRWDAQLGKFLQYSAQDSGLAEDRVMSLAMEGDKLWVGTMSGGVNIVENGRVTEHFFANESNNFSLSSNAVSSIMEDSKGDIWLTTYGGGVNRYLGDGRFQHYPDENHMGDFGDLRTLTMLESEAGEMWIATNGGGVIILDPQSGETRSLRHDPNDPQSLSSNNVISLLSVGGDIWIGTRDSGLNRFVTATSKIERVTKSEGLASDFVYGMLADDNGNLWISGGKGLSVYNPVKNTFSLYDSTHGLQNDDFNSGAFLKLTDGSFLFGGNNGFNAFYPDRVRGNTYIPPVKITRFSKFNKTVSLSEPIYQTEKLELEYDDSVIGFEFASMDFTAPLKNNFRYFLEGFDKGWVEAKGNRVVTYTNLDAGEYIFRVSGSNNDGVWNNQGSSIKIIVNPPVWATWWAYLIYLIIGVVTLYSGLKTNEQRLRRETEKRYSERLQLYIESLEEATDCVLIADANKHLMYANEAINKILAVAPSQAVGRSILSLLFSDPGDASLARAGLKKEGRWHGEVLSSRGSEFLTTEITIAAVHDDADNETAFVSIARDVTDRKKTEAELEVYRRDLEQLVGDRTDALKKEIAENKAFQVELADSLKEKELLLKEVHHRVKNNMQVISSLLNIQAETIGDETFSELLGESQQRIKSMALIHENLYQSDNLLEIDFKDYINMLANSLHRFYSVPGMIVSLDLQVDNVKLDIETAVPCGLIINELISNSLKHAFKGRQGKGVINVLFRLVDCRYVLEIIDDGIGLPEGFSMDSTTSMGMEIVAILTQQIDGNLRFEGKEGACFEISFPRKVKHA